jgi:hypothetical protein
VEHLLTEKSINALIEQQGFDCTANFPFHGLGPVIN